MAPNPSPSPSPIRSLIAVISLAGLIPARAEVPPFFKVDTLAVGIGRPTCLVHLPDGRILVNELGGKIKLIKDKKGEAIFSLPVSGAPEQGLLKMIMHPDFAHNGWLYLYYSTPDNDHHNIDRVTLGADNTVSGQINLAKLPKITNVGLHNGSAMAFGKDGNLYVGRGEDVTATWAPLWNTQRGKILRFTADGKPAPGNPHYDVAGASDEEKSIWARGFRNPWSLTYDPASGRLFEGDVGNLHEEINDVTAPDAAKDYWYGYGPDYPPGDGANPTKDGKTIDPLYYYNTGSIGCAVLGELPLTSPATRWPEKYKNRIYFSDYCNFWIRSVPMKPAGAGVDVNVDSSGMDIFAKAGFPNPLGLSQGIDGNMYLVGYGNGQVYRISYTGTDVAVRPASRSGNAKPISGVKAGRSADLLLPISGVGHVGVGGARFIVRGMDGRVLFRSAAEWKGRDGFSQWAEVRGFRRDAPGAVLYRLEWDEAGVARSAEGLLAILP